MLSHYTTQKGLEGIARTKTLWATDFLDLNDDSELLYGLTGMMQRGLYAAYDECKKLLRPDEIRRISQLDRDKNQKVLADFYRDVFARSAEHLHVVSFANSENADHSERGILTLWARYTNYSGYCLQYDETEVVQFLRREALISPYILIDLQRVKYGFDDSDTEYKELLNQTVLRLLGEVDRERHGLGVDPKFDQWWPDPTYTIQLLHYCAKHKDPFFEDERETRIIAVPSKVMDARPFSTFRTVKRVEQINSKRVIKLGEYCSPRIEPRRILIGPKAQLDISSVLSLFDRKPEVVVATTPIRC